MKRAADTNKLFFAFFLAILVYTAADGFSADLFNANLSSSERGRLAAGEILIRSIDKAKNMSLNPVNPLAVKTIDAVKRLNPSYLAEVIQIRPYNQGLLNQMKAVLTDVPSYKGIPYWSVTNQKWFELYSRANVRSTRAQDGTTTINAELVMDPFTPIDATITVTSDADTLFYSMINNNSLKAEGITAVKDRCMNSIIIVFRDGDSLVLYGIGGVKAPVIIFLKERIERSFMNRIKTFCMYVYGKL
ncbi:MAG: hypothetical protein Pg6C_18950 [Treponemataceae bacterium]|nr:MAG: hypothetical protein Pg6C_18760 [Treponemataceae bacterium]GMO52962.1 MAG: hypothetical protein Pg6C_18950 [Treponemataceae bacterium]